MQTELQPGSKEKESWDCGDLQENDAVDLAKEAEKKHILTLLSKRNAYSQKIEDMAEQLKTLADKENELATKLKKT